MYSASIFWHASVRGEEFFVDPLALSKEEQGKQGREVKHRASIVLGRVVPKLECDAEVGGESQSLEALIFILRKRKTPFLAPPLPVSQTSTRLKRRKDGAFRTLEDLYLSYSYCQK